MKFLFMSFCRLLLITEQHLHDGLMNIMWINCSSLGSGARTRVIEDHLTCTGFLSILLILPKQILATIVSIYDLNFMKYIYFDFDP